MSEENQESQQDALVWRPSPRNTINPAHPPVKMSLQTTNLVTTTISEASSPLSSVPSDYSLSSPQSTKGKPSQPVSSPEPWSSTPPSPKRLRMARKTSKASKAKKPGQRSSTTPIRKETPRPGRQKRPSVSKKPTSSLEPASSPSEKRTSTTLARNASATPVPAQPQPTATPPPERAPKASKTPATSDSPAFTPPAAPEPTPPPTTGRPARTRKPPNRLVAVTPPPKRPGRLRKDPYEDVERLLTHPKSRLAAADLTSLLTNPKAWHLLSSVEKGVLVGMLPARAADGLLSDSAAGKNGVDLELGDVERPAMLGRGNGALLRDVGRWKEDLENGFWEGTWQRQAKEAMQLRAEGTFDAWKEESTEAFWGQKMEVGGN